jgi:hypothetical protein
MRLVQFMDESGRRRTGAVVDGALRPLRGVERVYDLALAAIANKRSLAAESESRLENSAVDYDRIAADGRLLPPVDHPEPARFWITGTGLTHLGSADARDKMHELAHGSDADMTDSMKIFRMGLTGGKPAEGEIGVQPEWFLQRRRHLRGAARAGSAASFIRARGR